MFKLSIYLKCLKCLFFHFKNLRHLSTPNAKDCEVHYERMVLVVQENMPGEVLQRDTIT